MNRQELQQQFFKEKGIECVNSQGEPDIDYVEWLEQKALSSSPSGYSQEEQYAMKSCIWDSLTECRDKNNRESIPSKAFIEVSNKAVEKIIKLIPSPKQEIKHMTDEEILLESAKFRDKQNITDPQTCFIRGMKAYRDQMKKR